MNKYLITICLLFIIINNISSQENLYGYSGMPWNVSPQDVIESIRTPDAIILDNNEIAWINKDYFKSNYDQTIERFNIDKKNNINNILKNNKYFLFSYYDINIWKLEARMSIHFENNYATEESYYIEIDDLNLEEKIKLFNILKNQLQKQYGNPKSNSENESFKTLKWELYYTNIEIQLYTDTPSFWNPTPSSRGDYLRINYERNEISKKYEGLGFEIASTEKIADNINSNNKFTSAIESIKIGYVEDGLEVGDLVPNATDKDPVTIGLNHIINTTKYKNNELWVTRFYYNNIETWIFVYIWFTNTSPTGYNIRAIILPHSGLDIYK